MTGQFSDMTSSSNFFDIIFSCQVKLLVQVSCQYYHWFWSYDNFLFQGIDQKSGHRRYFRLSFAQYLETGTSKKDQTGHKRL